MAHVRLPFRTVPGSSRAVITTHSALVTIHFNSLPDDIDNIIPLQSEFFMEANNDYLHKEDTMKTTLLIAAVVCLTTGSLAMAFNPSQTMTPGAENGYLTVGRSVVVLPVPIQTGDRIELYNMHGARIIGRTVGDSYLSQNISTVPEGIYSLVIRRGHNVIATENVPVAGNGLYH